MARPGRPDRHLAHAVERLLGPRTACSTACSASRTASSRSRPGHPSSGRGGGVAALVERGAVALEMAVDVGDGQAKPDVVSFRHAGTMRGELQHRAGRAGSPRRAVPGVIEAGARAPRSTAAPHAWRIAGGSPATRDRWVRVSTWVSAGGRQEHPVDDVYDAVARLDVGLDDRDGVAAGVGQRHAGVAHADGERLALDGRDGHAVA